MSNFFLEIQLPNLGTMSSEDVTSPTYADDNAVSSTTGNYMTPSASMISSLMQQPMSDIHEHYSPTDGYPAQYTPIPSYNNDFSSMTPQMGPNATSMVNTMTSPTTTSAQQINDDDISECLDHLENLQQPFVTHFDVNNRIQSHYEFENPNANNNNSNKTQYPSQQTTILTHNQVQIKPLPPMNLPTLAPINHVPLTPPFSATSPHCNSPLLPGDSIAPSHFTFIPPPTPSDGGSLSGHSPFSSPQKIFHSPDMNHAFSNQYISTERMYQHNREQYFALH